MRYTSVDVGNVFGVETNGDAVVILGIGISPGCAVVAPGALMLGCAVV